jgi:hypothetical protein
MVRQLGTLVGRRDATQDDRTIAMGSQNRGHTMGDPLDNCMCIASRCMMWREGSPLFTETEAIEAAPNSQRPDGFSGYRAHDPDRPSKGGKWVKIQETARGYCGLAGRPPQS